MAPTPPPAPLVCDDDDVVGDDARGAPDVGDRVA
jgi:hypothetical protein